MTRAVKKRNQDLKTGPTEIKAEAREKEKEKEKARKEKGQSAEESKAKEKNEKETPKEEKKVATFAECVQFSSGAFGLCEIQSRTDRVGEKQQKAAFAVGNPRDITFSAKVEKEKNQQTDRHAEKGKEAESKKDENPSQLSVGKEGRQEKDINKLVEQLANEEGKSGASSPKSL
uniref:Protein MNN4-like n=1 Tax=Angiostrongylus cantonensis TaxID=6313 RepID=A0A0K0CU34_ANGCA